VKNKNGIDATVMTLGEAKIMSPIKAREKHEGARRFVADGERILVNIAENETR
jgi:hypothetical protein